MGKSWRHPQGWQAVVRTSTDQALVVLHAFADAPVEVFVPLPGEWTLSGKFGNGSAEVAEGRLTIRTGGDFSGAVFLLDHR